MIKLKSAYLLTMRNVRVFHEKNLYGISVGWTVRLVDGNL